jgi:hypothetical protein
LVNRLRPILQEALDATAREAHARIVTAHQHVEARPARYKHPLAIHALKQPWDGLAHLEAHGLLAAELAGGAAVNLPTLLDVLDAGKGQAPSIHQPVPSGSASDDSIAFMTDAIHRAALHRDHALAALSESQRAFLFTQGQSLAEQYLPQISLLSGQTMSHIEADTLFAELLSERVDYASLVAASRVLATLVDDGWLHRLNVMFSKAAPVTQVPPGITGEVMFVRHTIDGLIVIGGEGPNTYELDGRFALVIDLGGDDLYRGFIGASADERHGNSVVIDLAGNDRYEGAPLGLATGRLGVGILFDRAGNDVYALRLGSGGTGFGGVGILFDAEGDDVYTGERMTQGAAIGGLGLLIDGSGHDRYTSHGFTLGFGGPLGVGVVIDVRGNDQYQCGGALPSAYNLQDAPQGDPRDPLFQFDCFGLGVGAGFRVLVKQPEWQAKSLAGGRGMLIDLAGHDRYQSANFSQGMGYFFGTGLLLDLNGNDHYNAARYGQGASAHYGVALFVDHLGDDRYGSTGPYYNTGAAWDHGVSLSIDAGTGHDTYALDRTTGLGISDHRGWAIFVDEGGDDQYTVQSGLGEAANHSLAVFMDLDGNDRYDMAPPPSEFRPDNGLTISRATGGLFIDRH